MTAKDRILQFIDSEGLNKRSFEECVGLGNAYLQNSKGSIGSDKLRKIASHYPKLNIYWVVTGEGEMLKSESDPVNTDAGYIRGLLEENRQLNKKLAAANDEIRRLKKAIGEMGASRKKEIITVVEDTMPANA